MSCPDENVFAQIQAGALSHSELADFHRHLDTCPACLELASILGCIHDEAVNGNDPENDALPKHHLAVAAGAHKPNSQSPRRPPSQSQLFLIATQSVMLFCHVYSSVVLLPLLWSAFRAAVPPIHGILSIWPIHYVWLPFVLLWGTLGLLLACVLTVVTFRAVRVPGFALRSYALLSLPTVFLAPLAVCLLAASKQRQIRS